MAPAPPGRPGVRGRSRRRDRRRTIPVSVPDVTSVYKLRNVQQEAQVLFRHVSLAEAAMNFGTVCRSSDDPLPMYRMERGLNERHSSEQRMIAAAAYVFSGDSQGRRRSPIVLLAEEIFPRPVRRRHNRRPEITNLTLKKLRQLLWFGKLFRRTICVGSVLSKHESLALPFCETANLRIRSTR